MGSEPVDVGQSLTISVERGLICLRCVLLMVISLNNSMTSNTSNPASAPLSSSAPHPVVALPDEIRTGRPNFCRDRTASFYFAGCCGYGLHRPHAHSGPSALPSVMAGNDVMGAAQTGHRENSCVHFADLASLDADGQYKCIAGSASCPCLDTDAHPRVGGQVYESVKRYGLKTPLRSTVVFGGVDIGPQKEALRNGCEVLIATPGRLLDHVEQRTVNLSQVGILVLDEADRMLDMGFLPDLDRIMRLLPAQRQTLLFSATFSNEIRKLGRTYLKNPVELEVAKRNATADTVTQIAYAMAGEAKRAAVVHLVKSRGLKQVIVFSNTKIGTSRLARQLELDGVRAESIHGDKSQADRMKALEAFKAGELEVLVATDVAARGLDVAGVPCVINYDLPHSAEDYVHRIGRTGRAGASGEAISLFSPSEEKYLIDIEKLIKAPVTRGVLQIPGELLARAPVRDDSRPARTPRSGGEPECGGQRAHQ